MADKIVSQLRWYRENGTYSHTTTVEHASSKQDVSPIFNYKAPGMLQCHPCNMMIRRNGKLVSYKEFI